MNKKTIIINGKITSYWEKNPEKRKTMILIHGFPGNHHGLVDLARNLGDEYRLILPDLPASGESESFDVAHTLDNFVNWLSEFMKALKINNATILGHSYGARIGILFAVEYPKKVERLILITPPIKIAGLIARTGSFYYKFAQVLPISLRPLWFRNRLFRGIGDLFIFKSASPARRRELKTANNRELRHLDPKAHMEIFTELYSKDLTPLAKKIQAKTLVIAAHDDGLAPLFTIEEFAEKIPNGKLVVIEKAGHIVVLEKPVTTAKMALDWFNLN